MRVLYLSVDSEEKAAAEAAGKELGNWEVGLSNVTIIGNKITFVLNEQKSMTLGGTSLKNGIYSFHISNIF